MKKLLYTAALMLMATMALTSCYGGNQQWQDEQESTPFKKHVGVTYTINCSQDMLDATDLVVRIYKDSVDIVTDTIRETLWTKTIGGDTVPYHTGMIWTVKPKAMNKINKDTLDEIFAKYSVTFVGRDEPFDKGRIMHYRNLPVSKLEDACELAAPNYARHKWSNRPNYTINFDRGGDFPYHQVDYE